MLALHYLRPYNALCFVHAHVCVSELTCKCAQYCACVLFLPHYATPKYNQQSLVYWASMFTVIKLYACACLSQRTFVQICGIPCVFFMSASVCNVDAQSTISRILALHYLRPYNVLGLMHSHVCVSELTCTYAQYWACVLSLPHYATPMHNQQSLVYFVGNSSVFNADAQSPISRILALQYLRPHKALCSMRAHVCGSKLTCEYAQCCACFHLCLSTQRRRTTNNAPYTGPTC